MGSERNVEIVETDTLLARVGVAREGEATKYFVVFFVTFEEVEEVVEVEDFEEEEEDLEELELDMDGGNQGGREMASSSVELLDTKPCGCCWCGC